MTPIPNMCLSLMANWLKMVCFCSGTFFFFLHLYICCNNLQKDLISAFQYASLMIIIIAKSNDIINNVFISYISSPFLSNNSWKSINRINCRRKSFYRFFLVFFHKNTFAMLCEWEREFLLNQVLWMKMDWTKFDLNNGFWLLLWLFSYFMVVRP